MKINHKVNNKENRSRKKNVVKKKNPPLFSFLFISFTHDKYLINVYLFNDYVIFNQLKKGQAGKLVCLFCLYYSSILSLFVYFYFSLFRNPYFLWLGWISFFFFFLFLFSSLLNKRFIEDLNRKI